MLVSERIAPSEAGFLNSSGVQKICAVKVGAVESRTLDVGVKKIRALDLYIPNYQESKAR
jgi:hypothetical protein